MNQITYDGKPVNIGPTPEIIKECGFCDPDEVTLAANRMSSTGSAITIRSTRSKSRSAAEV